MSRLVRVVLVSSLVASAVTLTVGDARAASGHVRAFAPTAYWNTPLDADVPLHPSSDAIIDFLREDNARDGCVLLAGASADTWGTPVYWADASDPVYTVQPSAYRIPPEFAALRIPVGAVPGGNSDAEMVVYDLDRGIVAWLWQARYDALTGEWSAGGGSVSYLGSNGLDGRLAASDEPRNGGSQRGLNGAISQVLADEVAAGAIDHVLKIGVNTARSDAVFPMVGSDGSTSLPVAPAQGSRIRIKPSLDLDRMSLHPQAAVIARALQRYGAIIGDSTGGPISLKLEDTARSGRGQLWTVPRDALCAIPIDAFEVVAEGHGATAQIGMDLAAPVPTPDVTAVCPPDVDTEDGFVDVPSDNVHEGSIDCLVWSGIAEGTSRSTYGPAAPVTRGQMATFLSRAIERAGGELPPGDRDRFTDDDGHLHEANIDRLASAGIVNGGADGGYAPDAAVTRGQMATFLARAVEYVAGEPLVPTGDHFADDAGDAHEASIDAVASAGIASGTSRGVFAPDRSVRRDQMASFLVRTLAVVDSGVTS